MTKTQAKGYLLEVVVSKLIEVNGYELVSPKEEFGIYKKGNGLNVRGRGGYHQFDTLGKFRVTPPFLFPLRLFGEVKHWSQKVGIGVVRNGIGVLQDINTNYVTVDKKLQSLFYEKTYDYHYAIFSASGFTEDSQLLAMAHKIHLIDLSSCEYSYITKAIEIIIEKLFKLIGKKDDILSEDFNKFKNCFCSFLFEETVLSDLKTALDKYGDILKDVEKLKTGIEGRVIYLASVDGGSYIIPLLFDDSFSSLLEDNPHQKITIKKNPNEPETWTLSPINNSNYNVTFKIPEMLSAFLEKENEKIIKSFMNFEKEPGGKFVFISYFQNNPTFCTLEFNKQELLNLFKNKN